MSRKKENPEEFKDFDINQFIGDSVSISPKSQVVKKDESVKPVKETEQTITDEPAIHEMHGQSTRQRPSSKQRKASLQEYQQTFLSIPKITERKTVFISNTLREKIVSINLRFGTEKSSVSGFIENLIIHHLEEYKDDLENWKKL